MSKKGKNKVVGGGGVFARLRTAFLAGVLVVAPIGITIYIAQLFIDFVDGNVVPFVLPYIPVEWTKITNIALNLPGLGLVIVMIVITLIGAFTAGFFGRWVIRQSERIVNQMPVVRTLHGALKQILETVLAQKSTAFRDVVLVEYPRREMWVIGFVSGKTTGEVQAKTDDEVINVFVPTTPNPTSGFLIFVPRSDCIFLNMTIEEGIKMVVSGGIVTPDFHGNPEGEESIPAIDLYQDTIIEPIEPTKKTGTTG